MVSIDLNADVGEERGDDAALMPFITSANIACGAHAGSTATMRRTIELALKNGVNIGAHPGYADRANFGRTVMPLSAQQISEQVQRQLNDLAIIAEQMGTRLFHVKPHGALYNLAARDTSVAQAVAHAVADFDSSLLLMGLANSESIRAAQSIGLRTAAEAFVDRAYEADGTLRNRTLPGAVYTVTTQAIEQAVSIIRDGQVRTYNDTLCPLHADTLCIHGDTAHALDFARALRGRLADERIAVAPLAAR